MTSRRTYARVADDAKSTSGLASQIQPLVASASARGSCSAVRSFFGRWMKYVSTSGRLRRQIGLDARRHTLA